MIALALCDSAGLMQDSERVYGDEVYVIRDLDCPNQASYQQAPSSPAGADDISPAASIAG